MSTDQGSVLGSHKSLKMQRKVNRYKKQFTEKQGSTYSLDMLLHFKTPTGQGAVTGDVARVREAQVLDRCQVRTAAETGLET